MKSCSTCGTLKDLQNFFKDKNKKDGHQTVCKDCTKVYKREYYNKNKLKIQEYFNTYREDNREYLTSYNKKYGMENREKLSSANKLWKSQNPEKVRASIAYRRASKKNSTPVWLTSNHHKEIETFYKLARECEVLTGDKYHVDHIIPLTGENICGLHVPWNLQVLPADINLSKSNKYENGQIVAF